MFKTILFPVDSSRETREAADVVSNLVKTYHSRLILLSVVETSSPDQNKEPTSMRSPEEVAKLLENMQLLFQGFEIKAEAIEREGIPSFTICDVADEVSADLIVMGCRGLGLTNDGLAESVSHRVINLSPCAVLIVP